MIGFVYLSGEVLMPEDDRIGSLQRHLEALAARVEALIRTLSPDRLAEFRRLYAEIYTHMKTEGAKTYSTPEDEPRPPDTGE